MQRYYHILGLEPGATSLEIKRAFRRVARRYHPDRNPGDPVAEERFKEAVEAYEVLSSGVLPRHRRRSSAASGGRASTGGPEPPRRREARRLDLLLDMEALISTGAVDVELRRREPCGRCAGTGSEPGATAFSCPTCQGQGVYRISQGLFTTVKRCAHCSGSGTLLETPCAACAGLGGRDVDRTIKVRLPAGTTEGSELRLPGQGDWDRGRRSYGDLLVTVRLRDHPQFRRQGADIEVTLKVPFADLALGTTIEVPTLSGRRQVVLPSGTEPGSRVRLAGLGLPRGPAGGRGDLVIALDVAMPRRLSPDERALLEQLSGRRAAPSRRPLLRRWADRFRGKTS